MSNPELKQGEVSEQPQQGVVKEQEPPKEAPAMEEKTFTQAPPQPATNVPAEPVQPAAQQTPVQTVTITIPATTQQLDDWSKGSPDDSLTWLAFFWIRMIKKALFYGWNVITGGGTPQPQA